MKKTGHYDIGHKPGCPARYTFALFTGAGPALPNGSVAGQSTDPVNGQSTKDYTYAYTSTERGYPGNGTDSENKRGRFDHLFLRANVSP
ncbi:hypothetical protein GCM10027578_35520 [Spirosoma luteolum]